MSNSNIIREASKLNPNAEKIKELLEGDPNLIHARSPAKDHQQTLLHKCVSGGNYDSLECVKVLLAHEPKININALTRDWLLDFSKNENGKQDEGLTALDYAFQSEGPAKEEIIKLLEDNGATHSTYFLQMENDKNTEKSRKSKSRKSKSRKSKSRKSKSRKSKSRKNH